MATVTQDVRTTAPPADAYRAVSSEAGFRSWWTRRCRFDPRPGGEAEFGFYGGEAVMAFRIDELEPGRRVRMTCDRAVNTNPERAADQWVGTQLELEIEPEDGGSVIHLRHSGWPEDSPVLPQIRGGWAHFGESLRKYLDTGTGTPYADPE